MIGRPVPEIADELGVTEKAVRRLVERMGLHRMRALEAVSGGVIAPPLTFSGEFVVTSDWHIPYHNTEFVFYMLEVCKELGIKKMVIGGDFLNFDALSTFLAFRTPIDAELELAGIMLELLLSTFDAIYILPGNHDLRLVRKLEVPVSFVYLVRSFCSSKKVHVTDHDFVEAKNGLGKWRICHPKNYSQIKGRVAYRLASRFKCNIISAHGHFFGAVLDETDTYWCIDAGGMFDKSKIAYYHRTSTYPDWNNGFVVVRDREFLLFRPHEGSYVRATFRT